MDSTYDCKTQQNATLTGQEEEGDVPLKVSFSFVLLYFDFWTILVHGSFDDFSHFVPVNVNILTHTTSGPPVVLLTKKSHGRPDFKKEKTTTKSCLFRRYF